MSQPPDSASKDSASKDRASNQRASLALAGVLTGLAGVATSEAVVWALGAPNPPVSAVASAVRDFTPGPIAVKLVELVKHADKPLLIAGTALILLAITGYAGVVSGRRPLLADLIFFGLGMLGLGAVVRLPDSTVVSGMAVVVGLVTWIVALRFLTAALNGAGSPSAGRRAFLVRSGSVTVLALGIAGVGRFASKGRREVEKARKLLRLPATAGRVPADAGRGVVGAPPWRTPNGRFYTIHSVLSPPAIRPADWSLRIHGLVDQEITLDYNDVVQMELTEDWVTLCCVSNEVGGPLIGNAWWSGVLIRDVLAKAGVKAGADAVLQTSQDGWTCGTPLTALTDDRNAMLAFAMNGRPLPIEHGFPVRMVVPGLYGYVSATKWLVDLEVTNFDKFDAFWTKRGWSEKGPVKTESRIDVPRGGRTTKTGRIDIGGSAWAQHTGIEKVEFQLDGGPWQQAQLGGVPNLDTWVQWSGAVEVKSGQHVLAVRATDKSGYTQTSVRRDVLPDGATGWHTIEFEAQSS